MVEWSREEATLGAKLWVAEKTILTEKWSKLAQLESDILTHF